MPNDLMIFISYAHEDELLLKKLEKHLSTLKHQKLISLWHDREIRAGKEWKHEINKYLNEAHIILLLVSPAFINSPYCYGVEMKLALERHQRREACVIPIILRPTSWKETPLGELQALPTDAKPVIDPSWHAQDYAFVDIVNGIRNVVEEVKMNIGAQSASITYSQHAPIRYWTEGFERHSKFKPIGPQNLQSIATVVLALDSQWTPRSLLPKIMQTGYETASLERKRLKQARGEYIRALINSEQLIINLPDMYKNPAIYRDYLQRSQNRETLKNLLRSAVIVPYLYEVTDPAELIAETPDDMNSAEARSWSQLCQEVQMHCLRLSWSDAENWRLTRQRFAAPFNQFVTGAAAGDIFQYIMDLDLDLNNRVDLHKRLLELGRWCLDFSSHELGKLATRGDLYEAFVISRSNTGGQKNDNKPFASEIKQLLDLAYNAKLADALNCYLITPVDSLSRTALQEQIPGRAWESETVITCEDLLRLLQRTAFDSLQRGVSITSMDQLTLRDAHEIRRMEEWADYIQSLKSLLRDPLSFSSGGAIKCYQTYGRLATQITNLVAKDGRRQGILTAWWPIPEIAFYMNGAVLLCTWKPEGPLYQFIGQVSGLADEQSAPIIGRLIIRDQAEKQTQQYLSTSLDFMRANMVDAAKQWKELERQISKLPGYQETRSDLTASEIVDPTINYSDIDTR